MQFSNLQNLWWLLPALIVLAGGFYCSLVDRPRIWKWTSFGLRVVAVTLLVLALCRPFTTGKAENTHVVFLVDSSASISGKGMEQAVEQINAGIATLSGGDSYTVVRYDESSSVTNLDALKKLAEAIKKDGGDAQNRAASDLTTAILSSRMQFRSDKAKRIVVLSDGVSTEPGIDQALATLEQEGVEIDFYKLASLEKVEAAVLSFESLVPTAFEGEIVRLEGVVAANQSMPASVRLLHRGVEVQKQEISLIKGEQMKVGFEVEMYTSGNTRWTMELHLEDDYFPMNNSVSTTVQVSGKPRVLAIHKKPKDMRPLARALKKQGIELDVRGAQGLPSSLAEMLAFRAVLLCDVPATDLTVQQMFDLKSYVADMGGGLGMLGSENSFGIGGYYNTPIDEILPIASRYEKEKIKPSLAMVLVIDKSGSMEGAPIQLARQAAKSAVELLGGQDSIAVIGFDSNAQTIVEMTSASNKESIKSSIDTMAAGGGTNLYPGMTAAKDMLEATPAKIKHMIILSDGQTSGEGYEALAEDLVSSGVTISTVALGDGAAKELMQALATMGKGRYYETNDAQSVPQIFTKETMQASKSAIKEDLYGSVQVSEHPMLNGFEKAELPFIMGYVMTQPKATSKVLLATELGDPLLAVNRFGLGQTFAYTSDMTEKWGSEWLGWSSCGVFWNQAIRAILRKEDGRGIQLQSGVRHDELQIEVTRRDDAGDLVNQVEWIATALDDKKEVVPVVVQQTGIGKYSSTIPLEGKERVVIQLRDKADGKSKTLYWQRPYPAEFQLTASEAAELTNLEVNSLDSISEINSGGLVEKDRLPWFALTAVVLAIGSIFVRRV